MNEVGTFTARARNTHSHQTGALRLAVELKEATFHIRVYFIVDSSSTTGSGIAVPSSEQDASAGDELGARSASPYVLENTSFHTIVVFQRLKMETTSPLAPATLPARQVLRAGE